MSAVLENGMVTDLASYHGREQRRDSASRDAHNRLRDECIDALMHDPAREISTPGFRLAQSMPAYDVVLDGFSGVGDRFLEEMLRIVGRIAQGQLDRETICELQLRASALIAAQARKHAEMHRDILPEDLEDPAGDADEARAEQCREDRVFGEA